MNAHYYKLRGGTDLVQEKVRIPPDWRGERTETGRKQNKFEDSPFAQTGFLVKVDAANEIGC